MTEEPTNEELSDQLNRFVAAGTAVATTLARQHRLPITYKHVQQALEDVLSVERGEHLLRGHLDEARMLELLRSYQFAGLFPQVLTEVVFEESVIPAGALRRLEERTVKAGGEIWRVYKNDADPFPSNPHAHNLDSGLKLHLGTGELFLKTRPAGKIDKKLLKKIRGELGEFALPELQA